MNKKIVYAVFISALGLSLFAAGQKESYDAEKPEWSQQRTRIVNLSPPIYSMLLTFPYLADFVVGVNQRTFSTSNPQVLQIVSPGAKISTLRLSITILQLMLKVLQHCILR